MGVPNGPWYVNDLLTFTVITHRSNGNLSDADTPPTYRLYEDETGTPILSGSMAKLDDAGTTGFYSEQITLSAANGFEAGKSYAIYVTATVQSTAGGQTLNFKVIATPAADLAAIKAKTDALTFTVAGQLDSNIRAVNSVPVSGAGTPGAPWGP